MSRSKKSIRALLGPKKVWREPRPSKKEAALAREGDVHQAAFLMAERLKIAVTSAYHVLRPLYQYVRYPIAIDGLGVEVSTKGDVSIRISIDGLYVQIPVGYRGNDCPFSWYTTAGGLRHAIHREVQGCDERAYTRGKKLMFKRCERGGHC